MPTAAAGRDHPDQHVPRWRLRCKREGELQVLNGKLCSLIRSMLGDVRYLQLYCFYHISAQAFELTVCTVHDSELMVICYGTTLLTMKQCCHRAACKCLLSVGPASLYVCVNQYVHSIDRNMAKSLAGCVCLSQADPLQQSVLQQQKHAWDLLSVLYSAIESEPEVNLPDKPSLQEMLRRQSVSKWLQVSTSGLPGERHLLLLIWYSHASFTSDGVSDHHVIYGSRVKQT